jgi:hypothetical protein
LEDDVLVLIIAGVMTAGASSSSFMPFLAETSASAAVAPRKVCHDEPMSNSRFTKRVCTLVKPPQAVVAPEPVVTTLAVGMPVVDAQGGSVGVITALAVDNVIVKTDKHEAQLPKSSMTISEGKAIFGQTQAELDASIEKMLAAAPRLELKAGAPVKDAAGASVGTIEALTPENVTIRLASGQRVNIPRSGIALNADGSAMIGVSAADLEAQLKAAQPAH